MTSTYISPLRIAALTLASGALLAACSPAELQAPLPTDVHLQQTRQALGEVIGGHPSEQERMLLVLMNQARHSPTTPNNNECGDYTAQYGADVKLPPFSYSREANLGARFSARHMSEVGCYQNDNCCVLGDAGVGVGCVAPGACSGQACQQTCDAGVGQNAEQRYGLFGFNTLSGVSISQGDTTAYNLWCRLMMNAGQRDFIYSDAGTEFAGGQFTGDNTASCKAPYWALAYGRGAVTPAKIPAGSAMYSPPNPINTSSLYFAANYFDSTGKAPRRSAVVVAGHCFDMDKKWGYDDNGTYETRFPDPDVIPEGCHPYYFLFTDGDGNRQVYPSSGSLQIAIGANSSCPLTYDPAPQLTADCESSATACPAGETRPCYTQDVNTLANGECRQGRQLCRNGFWGACRDMVGPFPEVCDGLDNDCDGEIDEGNLASGQSCTVGTEIGLCQSGIRACRSGRIQCVSNVQPTAEVCDNLDNDCDGAIDDGFPMATCGQGLCFRMVPSCNGGIPGTCTPGTPATEVADLKDNNCDGQVDEGFDCRRPDGGFGNSRDVWPIPGTPTMLPCSPQRQVCQSDGGWGLPFGGRLPRPEECNGEDDDCDGLLDNARETQVQLGYDRCGSGSCSVFSSSRCVGGTPKTCMPIAGAAETCDGLDNDCDGTTDESCSCRNDDSRGCYTGPSETRDVGECKGGMRPCVNGNYTRCMGDVKPTTEICDNKDNDCDGMTDDNCVAGDAGSGGGSATGGGSGTGGGDTGGGAQGGGSATGGAGGSSTPMKPCGCNSSPADGAVLMLALGLLLRRKNG